MKALFTLTHDLLVDPHLPKLLCHRTLRGTVRDSYHLTSELTLYTSLVLTLVIDMRLETLRNVTPLWSICQNS